MRNHLFAARLAVLLPIFLAAGIASAQTHAIGGGGRDLLLGGAGDDSASAPNKPASAPGVAAARTNQRPARTGGVGDDVLIGGTTSYQDGRKATPRTRATTPTGPH